MIKRIAAVVLASVLSLTAMAGCQKSTGTSSAGSTASGQAVTIQMSDWLETESATTQIFKNLLTDFQSKNPNIKVSTVGYPFNNYKDQLMVASSSGNAPDVMQVNSQMVAAINGAGISTPLNSLIGKDVVSDYSSAEIQGCTFNGKLVSIPWVTFPLALYYNKDLFKQAGLNPDNPPKTWSEMMTDATAIANLKKDANGNQLYGLAVEDAKQSHAGATFYTVIYSFGGQLLDKSGNVTFNSAETKAALQWLKDGVSSKIIPSGLEIKDIRGIFAQGRVGMCIDGSMAISVFESQSGKGKDFDKTLGVTTIPTNKTNKSETVYTEHQLMISQQSKNKAAAAKLIEYLVGKDALEMYHKTNGIASARKSIMNLAEMNDTDYMKVFNKQEQTASPLPATFPTYDDAMLEVTKCLEKITVGNQSVDSAVQDTQKKIESLRQSAK